jgi:hypothetical protein
VPFRVLPVERSAGLLRACLPFRGSVTSSPFLGRAATRYRSSSAAWSGVATFPDFIGELLRRNTLVNVLPIADISLTSLKLPWKLIKYVHRKLIDGIRISAKHLTDCSYNHQMDVKAGCFHSSPGSFLEEINFNNDL